MKTMFAAILLAAAFAIGAQEIIETPNGSYRVYQDDRGRSARLESSDGIVIDYLYDSPAATAESGVAIRVSDKVTLTVHYNDRGDFWAPGLPKISMTTDADGRTLEIRADHNPLATFAYRSDKYIDGVSLPGHLTMLLTPPDERQHVRQTLQNAAGAIVWQRDVVSSAGVAGVWSGWYFDTVGRSLDFNPRQLDFKNSPGGYLTTARDADGEVALYIVSAGSQSVGFTADGVARYYDLTANIFDSEIPAGGGDCAISVSLDQNKAAPDHITLTADGAPGLYVEEPARGAICAAWVERGDFVMYSWVAPEPVTPATPRF